MKKLSAIAVAVLALSGSAFAEDDIGTYWLDPSMSNQDSGFSAMKTTPGAFYDVFSFAFTGLSAPPSVAVGLAVHVKVGSTPDVQFTDVWLNGVQGTWSDTDYLGGVNVSQFFAGPVAFDASNNPAFKLEVWGTAQTNAQYGGTLNVAVVPEPETYAMMLAGLGVLGFLASRRRREG